MFTRSFLASSVALLVAASQVSAHCFISPGLGVSGVGVRNDVQRPSTASPCGSAPISDISTSTAAQAVNGLFSATATNFNGGTDGSTEIVSAKVDTTGTGKSFTGTATVVKNGVKSPTTVGSVPLQIQLASGTVCTGPGGRCLVSVTTAGGFGNCLVVSTGASTGTAATTGKTTTTAAGTTGKTDTTGKTAAAATTKHHHHHHNATTAANVVEPKANVKTLKEDDTKQKRDREQARNALTFVRSVKRNVGAVRSWVWA